MSWDAKITAIKGLSDMVSTNHSGSFSMFGKQEGNISSMLGEGSGAAGHRRGGLGRSREDKSCSGCPVASGRKCKCLLCSPVLSIVPNWHGAIQPICTCSILMKRHFRELLCWCDSWAHSRHVGKHLWTAGVSVASSITF